MIYNFVRSLATGPVSERLAELVAFCRTFTSTAPLPSAAPDPAAKVLARKMSVPTGAEIVNVHVVFVPATQFGFVGPGTRLNGPCAVD